MDVRDHHLYISITTESAFFCQFDDMRHVRMAKIGLRDGRVLLTELHDDWNDAPDFVGNILYSQQSTIWSDLIDDLDFCADLKLLA